MFDIGFSEVLLIFVIALVVLGPEKLPRVASQVGRWIGRARAMARQFREQLEEEVNLEQVRKAHEQKKPAPGAQPDASSQEQQPAGTSATTSPSDTPWGGSTAPSSAGASEEGPVQGTGQQASTQPQSTGQHDGTQSQGTGTAAGSTSAAAGTSGAAVGSYHGPDPADFRADTFSHAHPTNEHGANPYTSNGAAEEQSSAASASPPGSNSAAAPVSPGQSQFAFEPRTASEANVAAAQPQPEPAADKRADSSEAYAPPRPRDNTPGTDNHGN